ncbi:MAG: hypothetical protein ABI831_05285 [Betaproteobacteria bacterium]
MELRKVTMDSSNAGSAGYSAASALPVDVEEVSYFPQAPVAILDIDFSDEYATEPDGVNDFFHRMESEELDQL